MHTDNALSPEVDIAADELQDSPIPEQVLGDAFPQMVSFHDMLRREGLTRGLIGPRELPIIWERHILNSAAVVPFIKQHSAEYHGQPSIIDIGSGGGFPGIVVASMLPEIPITLVEPMERRVEWLEQVATTLELSNVSIVRARAEDALAQIHAHNGKHHHSNASAHITSPKSMNSAVSITPHISSCSIVTCRAVAPLRKLVAWTLPFLEHSGQLVALKGKSALQEIETADKNIHKFRGKNPRVVEAQVAPGLQSTRVVLIDKA